MNKITITDTSDCVVFKPRYGYQKLVGYECGFCHTETNIDGVCACGTIHEVSAWLDF